MLSVVNYISILWNIFYSSRAAKIADTGTMGNEEEDDITFDIDQEDDEIDDVIYST